MNLERLNQIILESGLKKKFIADALNISEGSLRNKLHGKTPFTWKQVQVLTRILHLSAEVCEKLFFIPEVADMATKEA